MKALSIGQAASMRRTFTPADIAAYRSLAETNDAGPVESPAPAAAGLRIPVPLLGSLFSYLLGTQLPGRGTNYLKQRLLYRAPAYAGEELLATVEIIRLRPEKDLVNLRTLCTASDGRIVCEGEALVLVKDVGA